MGERRPRKTDMDERLNYEELSNFAHELLGQQVPLITTTHESLPVAWNVEEGLCDLVRSLCSERDDQRKIAEMGLQIVCMLLTKNRQYGNAALDPLRVFTSDLSARDMISVRLDDKLSRIKRGSGHDDEDPKVDLIGYLILDLIAAHDEERASRG